MLASPNTSDCVAPNGQFKKIGRKCRDIWSQHVCRVCLKLGTVPIYGNDASDISEAVQKFGEIKVCRNDGFPKYLCVSCHDMLKGAINFQRKAKESDIILRQLEKRKNGPKPISINSYHVLLQKKSHVGPVLQVGPNLQIRPVPRLPERTVDMVAQNDLFYDDYSEDITSNSSHSRDSLDGKLNNLMSNPPLSPSLSGDFSEVPSDIEYSHNKNTHQSEQSNSSSPAHRSKVKCKTCNKIVLRSSAKNHRDIHDSVKKYVCEQCGKRFSQKIACRNHSRIHNINFIYKCDSCPYKSNIESNLARHMRSHSEDFKYLCSQCPKKFRERSNLNRHMLLHDSKTSYKCSQCENTYREKHTLQMHIDVVHLGIKNHVCNQCGAAFGYRKRLLAHQFAVHNRKKMGVGRIPSYIRVQSEGEVP